MPNIKQINAMAKMKASIKDKIETGLDGRKQVYVIKKMQGKGINISDSQFSRKKMGYDKFKENELEALSEILNIDFE